MKRVLRTALAAMSIILSAEQSRANDLLRTAPPADATAQGSNSGAGVIGEIHLDARPAPPLAVSDTSRQIQFDMLLLRLNWKQLRASQIDLGQLTSQPSELDVVAPAPLPPEFAVAALEPARADGIVLKLVESRSAERISEPTVITLEGQPAHVQIAEALPHISTIIEETVNGRHQRRVETRETGQNIRLTPKLLDGGQVAISIDAESSQLMPDAKDASPSSPTIRSRVFRLQATVDDGQTLILSELPPADAETADSEPEAADAEHGLMLLVTPKILGPSITARLEPGVPAPKAAAALPQSQLPPWSARPLPTSPTAGPQVACEISMWRGVDRRLLEEAGITREMLRAVRSASEDSEAAPTGVVGHVIQPEWARHVRERLQASPQASVTLAPKITLFNGQTGNVLDRTEIPATVIHEIVNGKSTERLDLIRLGTALDLTPAVLDGDRVRLGVALEHTQPLESGEATDPRPRRVQTCRWQAESIVPSGSVLLLADSGLFDSANNGASAVPNHPASADSSASLFLMITPTILPYLTSAPPVAEAPRDLSPPPRAVWATAADHQVASLGRRMELSHRAANLREAARNLKSAGAHDMAAQVARQAEEAELEVRRLMEATAAQASSTRTKDSSDGLRDEIRELRGEVQELRRDVGRLIELLEARVTPDGMADPESESDSAEANEVPPGAQQEVTALIESIERLLERERFAEAEVVGSVARSLAPDDDRAEVLYWKARYARRLANEGRAAVQLLPSGGVIQAHPRPFTAHELHPGTNERTAILRKLDEPITLSFDKVPLSRVLKEISNGTDMNVALDTAGLEEEGVTPDAEVSLNVDGIKLASALKLMLDPLHLNYVIEDEVLKITSKQRSRGGLEVRNYAVADFVFADAPDESKSKALDHLAQVISGTVEPDSWDEMGGPGSIRPYLPTLSLVVRQSFEVHEQIADLLQQLRQVIRGIQPEPPAATAQQPQQLVIHTYAVADLVNAGPVEHRVDFLTLAGLIQENVEPDQWDTRGGSGSIQPFESTKTLIIRQTPDVHREITELLNQIRSQRERKMEKN